MKDLDKVEINISDDMIKSDDDKVSEIMGRWETPLMHRYAHVVNEHHGHILEVGFGLGIFATEVYNMGLKSYTIIEIHPKVLEKLYEWAEDKSNVTIIEGDWFDNLDLINSRNYDGIFFDTHLDDNRHMFRELVVDKSLNDNGIFGWFTIGQDDTFGYNNINTEMMRLKTTDNSDYHGLEIDMKASWFKKINN